MKSFPAFSTFLFCLVGLLGCTEMGGTPYYNDGYRRPYYDSSPSYYDSSSSYYDRRERKELNKERQRIENERERLENERERLERERNRPSFSPPPPPPPVARPQPERCPPGFSQSENKCSPEERRRGCKDMRLPGGLGCVRR